MSNITLEDIDERESVFRPGVNHHRSSLLVNGLSNWGPLGTNLVIGFFLIPYLIAYLGKAGYGIWALIGSFIGYYGLLHFGVGAGIMRYVPFYTGRNQQDIASDVVSTAMAIFLFVGVLIIFISSFLAESAASFYKTNEEFVALFRIMALAAAIECPMLILDGTIRAHEKWVYANFVTVTASVLRAAGLIACVHLGYGLVQMGFVILIVTTISLILMAILFVKLCPTVHLHPKRIKYTQMKELLTYGMFTTIVAIVYSMRFQAHNLIIGKVISLEAVAIYGVAAVLINNIRAVVVAPNRVFVPRFAYLDGGNKHKKVASLFLRSTKINAIFSSSLILIILVAGPAFISIWVGDTFQSVYPALMILAVGVLVETSLTATGLLLAATGHQRGQAIISSIEGFIGFGLSILLAWRLGLTGIAMGFLISITLMRGIVCPLYICRLHRMSVVRYYLDSLLRPWLIMFMLAAAAHYVRIATYIQTWTSLVVVIAILLTAYSACVYAVAINAETRKAVIFQFIRRFLALVAKTRESN